MSRSEAPSISPCTRDARPQGRRGFLVSGALAAALPAAARADRPASALASDGRLAVGYWPGQGQGGPVRAAQSLLTGDARFRQCGVRLGVLGLAGPLPPELLTVSLVSHTAVPGVAQDLPVLHWGLRAQPVASSGSASSQVVATGADGVLKLTLEFRRTTDLQRQVLPLVLSSGWMPGAAKLRRGVYALAFEHGQSALDWSGLQASPGLAARLPQIEGGRFPHLMLSVDYAS